MLNPVAVKLSPSTSPALASSSAWVMRRGPLSSAIAVRATGVVVGAMSLTLATDIATGFAAVFPAASTAVTVTL